MIAKNKSSFLKCCTLAASLALPHAIAQCPNAATDNLIKMGTDNQSTNRRQFVDAGTIISWVSKTDWQSPVTVAITRDAIFHPEKYPLCASNPTNTCTVNPDSAGRDYTYTYCSNPALAPTASACTGTNTLIQHDIRVRNTGSTPQITAVTLALDDPNDITEVSHVIPVQDTCVQWRQYDDEDAVDGEGDVIFSAPPPRQDKKSHDRVEILASDHSTTPTDAIYSICDNTGSNCVDPTLHMIPSGSVFTTPKPQGPDHLIAIICGIVGIFAVGLIAMSISRRRMRTR